MIGVSKVGTMTRDEARQHFKDSKLAYEDLRRENLIELQSIIQKHLDIRNATYADTKMTINKRLSKPSFRSSGSLVHAELTMRSHYFNSREAINFDKTGFIGFAGWADNTNVAPLISAFKEWVDGFALAPSSPTEQPQPPKAILSL